MYDSNTNYDTFAFVLTASKNVTNINAVNFIHIYRKCIYTRSNTRQKVDT